MGKTVIPDEAVKLCPEELPEGLLSYCREVVQPEDSILLYKKRSRDGFCYRCGCHVTGHFSNGSYDECPRCHQKVVVYTETYSNWRVDYIANIITIQRGPDGTLWLREWHINRRLRRIDIDRDSLAEIARWAISGNAVAKWQKEAKEAWGMAIYRYSLSEWTRYKNLSEIYDGRYYFYLPEDWHQIVAGTQLQYCDLGYFQQHFELNIARLLLDWVRYPAVEKLWKAGFTKIVGERSNGWDKYRQIRWNRNSVRGALNYPLSYLDRLQEDRSQWSVKDLSRLVELSKMVDSGELKERDLLPIFRLKDVDVSWILPALPYATGAKIAAYLNQHSAMDWRDYLKLAVELGLDLGSRQVLFPADLNAAEQALVEQRDWKANQAMMERFTAWSKKLERLEWHSDGLLIRPARSPAELRAEGNALHHCVATYAEEMSKKKTAILFIRKDEDPEVPYYTLELKHGRVVQCRTKNNASYIGTEVEDFVKAWLAEKKIAKAA